MQPQPGRHPRHIQPRSVVSFVEVRVADVCIDAGTAGLAAGLTRALVATALAEARQRNAGGGHPARQVDTALAAAARHEPFEAGTEPVTGQAVDWPRSAPACSIMSMPGLCS